MPQKNTQENTQNANAVQPSSPSSSNEGSDKPKNRGGKGRRKIEIKYIQDKTRRQITVSIFENETLLQGLSWQLFRSN